jgi:hypothetical protein
MQVPKLQAAQSKLESTETVIVRRHAIPAADGAAHRVDSFA